ncbi:MAG: hypothetical protein HOW73_44055 [Polyangiaceae bacterium]|nr:hypothetical protein [Polyangiaceae bacterium]
MSSTAIADVVVNRQEERLRAIIAGARIARELGPIVREQGHRVHFRPSSRAVTMVGLLPDRPQRGVGKLSRPEEILARFEELFRTHCEDIDHGRPTAEKALQSWIIKNAQTNGGRMLAFERATAAAGAPVELVFVTDEISLPSEDGKIVCDLLALRIDGGRQTPVVIELKSAREMTRLIAQVDAYARLVDLHAALFGELYATLLDREVHFDGPSERWSVWPRDPRGGERREPELAARGIHVLGYEMTADGYELWSGRASRLIRDRALSR